MENSQQLATQLAQYDANRKSSTDVLNEAMSKYGVPEIRARVSGLRTTLTNTENALNAVDPSVTGRTQGSLVTEAQRSKQVANERAPIAEQYGTFSRSLADSQADLSDQEKAAQLLAQGQLNDYEAGRTALAGRYSLAVDRENEQRRREEADRAYQLEVQKAAREAAATKATSYGFGNSSKAAASSPQADPNKVRAQNAVNDLLNTKNPALIQKTYEAIKKSAGYGNTYDQLKLQLIESLYPASKNFGKPITLSGSLGGSNRRIQG